MAPRINEFNKAEVQGTTCMGCGSCTAECPAVAITLRHYMDSQILGALDGLMFLERAIAPRIPLYPEQVGVAAPRWHKSREIS
jgi:ferredoxin